MKKVFVSLVVVAGLILLGTSVFADVTVTEEDMAGIAETPVTGIEVPEISLEVVTTDVKTAIEMRPVSLIEYFDFSIDFVSALLIKLAKTAEPVYVFNGQIGVEVSIFEQPSFDVIWGICQSGNQFYGIEIKGLPLSGTLGEIFKKVHPIIVYYKGDGCYFTAGICYEFRAD